MIGRFKFRGFLLLLTFFHVGSFAFSQKNQAQIDSLVQPFHKQVRTGGTSVYLRVSKNIYETMEDLWFKAYILDSQGLVPSDIDRTLYVELKREANDSIVYQGKYLIENGIVQGHIYVPGELTEGNYIISAYSSRSFESRNNFHAFRRLRIIRDLYALQKPGKTNEGKATIQKDTMPQFTLFAEGGHLVAEINSRVAFKAVNRKGFPVEVKGKVLEDGVPIQDFKSLYNGMGSFNLTARLGKKYDISVQFPGFDTIIPYPKIYDNGILMQMTKNSADTLQFKLSRRGGTDENFYLRIQTRGAVQLIASGVLKDSLMVNLPLNNVASGIAEATLFDKNFRAVAERLVYIGAVKQINIATHIVKETFGKREKIKVRIKTTDHRGQPVAASLGVTVFDDIYENRLDTKNILTHYLLETQLKGRIFNLEHYFDSKTERRDEKFDNLLMTQGWRNYIWGQHNLSNQPQDLNFLLPDTLSGQLIVKKKQKKAQAYTALMLLAQDVGNGEIVVLDSSGRFTLSHQDLTRGKQMYLKCFGEQEYKIVLPKPFEVIDSARTEYINPEVCCNETKSKQIDSVMLSRIAQGGRSLKEVIITNKGSSKANRGKQIGLLDSLARLEGNTDYVGDCGWLNCPAQSTGTLPVEGKEYPTLIGDKRKQVNSHPYYFGRDDFKVITYHYEKFTDEQVLEKLRLTRIQGYDGPREFYEPNYDSEESSTPDFRNTLFWSPTVNTNAEGEATIEFFSSDVTGSFVGIIEGIGANGQLGKSEFALDVN